MSDTAYMTYASEAKRSVIRALHPGCPMASFVVKRLGANDDGTIACIEVATRRELSVPAGELRPANKYEAMAGKAAELMDSMPERKFPCKPEPFAVGRWSVDEICARTGLSEWVIHSCIKASGMKTVLRRENVVFRASKMVHYTDANKIIDACIPPKGWCTRKQATEMTGLDKARLDRSGVQSMRPPSLPGAPKTVWYSIDGLRDLRRTCAMYGCVTRVGRKPKQPDPPVQVDVEVPRGATAVEHIALIRKAVDGRRKAKVNIIYK